MRKNITSFILIVTILIGYQGMSQDYTKTSKLVDRYQNLSPNGHSVSHFFTSDELVKIKEYTKTNSQENLRDANKGGALMYVYNSSTSEYGTMSPPDLEFTALGPNSPSGDFESSCDINPNDLNMGYGLTLEFGDFFSLNLTTGAYIPLGSIPPPAGEFWNGVEFDPSSGVLYAISSNFTNASTLSIVDIAGLSSTPVGDTGMPAAIAIAITSDGDMYSYDVETNEFYEIDRVSGVASSIGSIGFNANFGQDLEWDDASSTMYMMAYNVDQTEGELRTVDLTTGATTLIGNIAEQNTQIPWAAIQNEIILGVDNESLVSFSVFPNPTSDILRVTSKESIDTFRIINVLGQEVFGKNRLVDNQINVSGLQTGVYLLQITSGNKTQTIRFEKK